MSGSGLHLFLFTAVSPVPRIVPCIPQVFIGYFKKCAYLQPINPVVPFSPLGAQCAMAANSNPLGSVDILLSIQVALRDPGDSPFQ